MRKTAEKPLFTPEDLEVSLYDTVEFLDSNERIAGLLSVCLTENYDPDIFLAAIGDALRAKGLNTIESLLKIAEEMRSPADSGALPSTRAKAADKKTAGKKVAAKRASARPKPRKQRAAAVA